MERIFNQAKDKNVALVKFYKKTADADYLYLEAAGTNKVAGSVVQDAFHKGCIIVDGDNEYVPVACVEDGGVVTLTYVTADGTTATTAVLATLKSEEYDPN